MPKRTRNLVHRHNRLALLVVFLIFKTHGAQTASPLCLPTPCPFPAMDIDQLPTGGEDFNNWGYRTRNRQNKQFQEDMGWDYRAIPKGVEDNPEWEPDYDALPAILEGAGDGYEDGFASRHLIMLLLRLPFCDPTVSKCQTKEDYSPERYDNQQRAQTYRLPDKRSRLVSQRWSAAGLPFSVLYHKQVRAKSSYGNERASGGESQNVAPAPQRATDTWSSHGVTARRQYSTLPHLFVSYGWGPLGK